MIPDPAPDPTFVVPDWTGGAGDCFWCGRRCEPPADGLTRDHIVPLSQGGVHDYSNIAPACYQCNQARGRVAEYAGRLKAYRAGAGASPKALRQLWDLYPDAAAAYARWYDVEMAKVGYSPTAAYDVSEPPEPRPPDPPPQPPPAPPRPAVPAGPGVGRFRLSGRDTGGSWAADVEAARRRAEGLPPAPVPEPPAQREALARALKKSEELREELLAENARLRETIAAHAGLDRKVDALVEFLDEALGRLDRLESVCVSLAERWDNVPTAAAVAPAPPDLPPLPDMTGPDVTFAPMGGPAAPPGGVDEDEGGHPRPTPESLAAPPPDPEPPPAARPEVVVLAQVVDGVLVRAWASEKAVRLIVVTTSDDDSPEEQAEATARLHGLRRTYPYRVYAR